MKSNVVMLESLFTSARDATLRRDEHLDARQVLDEAEIIFSFDLMSGTEVLVFGRDLLQEVLASESGRRCRVLRIGIDQHTNDFEKLLAAVRVVKGSHDVKHEEGASS